MTILVCQTSLCDDHASGTARLSAAGGEGSQGKVTYELYHPKNPKKAITFTVDFCDPFGMWNDNSLSARASNPQLVSCNVLSYPKTGHPFSGE